MAAQRFPSTLETGEAELKSIGEPVPSRSTADHSVSPPAVRVPRDYNAAYDLIERNLAAGRAAMLAYVDDAGQYTFGELAERVDRFGSGLQAMGLEMEHRVLLALTDTIDFPPAFLAVAAISAASAVLFARLPVDAGAELANRTPRLTSEPPDQRTG